MYVTEKRLRDNDEDGWFSRKWRTQEDSNL